MHLSATIQVCKSCLFVVLKQLCWQRRSVCMCTGTEMLQYWLSTGSWMLCRTTMYINTQLQNIKLKWASQIPLSYSLYELHSHFFHTFPTRCDLVLSVWRHLFSYTTFFCILQTCTLLGIHDVDIIISRRRFVWLAYYFACFKCIVAFKKRKGGSGVWPSMVTHTRNLSSAFNPSKCTLTAVNTHLEQWAAILRRPGSSWGIGALLKGLTSVVVLKVERALVIHSPHLQSLPDLGIEPATFGLQVQLSNH